MAKSDDVEKRQKKAREEATIRESDILNAETDDYPGHYMGCDDAWDLTKFVKNLRIEMVRRTDRELEFDMIGINPSIANAFRRILISEVPTIAVDKVHIYNNTSIFQDDFLSHRLGLIPIKADPRFFEYKQEGEDETQQDTLVFELKVKCSKDPQASKETSNPDLLYLNRRVYTKHLKWIPLGTQKEMFAQNPITPVEDDILIAKLSPGQEIDVKLFCVKGIGRDHTKWSPVATASYRLLPKITLTQKVYDEQAEKLKACFSEGVIEVTEVTEEEKAEAAELDTEIGSRKAVVVNPRLDSCSRNVFRFDDLKDTVELGLIKDHFIFSIESTGGLPPEVLMEESIEIMMRKCRHFLEQLNNLVA
jgi:DNA-directed RNA polymerase I and III subunit RPAC1